MKISGAAMLEPTGRIAALVLALHAALAAGLWWKWTARQPAADREARWFSPADFAGKNP